MVSKARKVCVVTGTRAEYGLLRPLLKELRDAQDLALQLIVTGTHLSALHGMTALEIEADGFAIHEKIDLELTDDSPPALARSIGLGTIGMGQALARLQPDLLVILGDRFELLAAAQAALMAKIPVAHLAGGDITEGAFDDAIRHALTKMAHLHFAFHEESARRVRQLGEDPAHIFTVGSTGIDAIRQTALLSREDLTAALGIQWKKRNLLITFHPATWDSVPAETQFEELLRALAALPDTGLIFTLPNSDTGGRAIIARLERFLPLHPEAKAFASLGQQRYLSVMAQADAVVGNSSSGIFEAPALRRPTVDIGDRQKGRIMAASVVHCEPKETAILAAIQKAYALDCSKVEHPYGDGKSATRILGHLRDFRDWKALVKKKFHDI